MYERKIHVWAPGYECFGGGITAFSREFSTAVNVNDSKVTLFGKIDRDETWANLPLVPGEGSALKLAVRGTLAAVKQRPSWIVSAHLNFGPAVRWAARLSRCQYALVAHGIDVHPGLSNARLKALRGADRLIAVSSWTRDLLLGLGGIAPGKIQILPNTYDDFRFVPGSRPVELVSRYGLKPEEKVILTVARLDPGEGYKGYDRVLRALPGLRKTCGQVRYIIAGKGRDRERLEKIARELGVAESVTFTGFVPDEELADHYRLANVFAMPSTGEGFGIVFLEAMGCGTPVLGGNRDGSVDALDQGRLGKLVDPMSVEEIETGLAELLQGRGNARWFDRFQLSKAVQERFGRAAFRYRVDQLFP